MAIRTERITLYGEDSTPYDVNVIIDDSNGGLAIDYTQSIKNLNLHLDRIATALEPTDSSRLADNLSMPPSPGINPGDITEIVEQVTRVANSLETSDSTNFADAVSANTSRFASALETSDSTNFADNIAVIRSLAEGDGIRTLGPYETFSHIAIYKLFVEEGKILEFLEGESSEEQKIEALNKILEFVNKIKNNIPKDF
jgi:hypothetical protein